jgi:bacterial/archaeal transporter family protein
MSWFIFAILSAIFAALVSILAKIGLKDVNSNLATAIRTTIVLIFTWGIAFAQGLGKEISEVSKAAWIFLTLSGIATGLSWLFYFRALQMGEASKVMPIDKLSIVIGIVFATLFLGEKLSWMGILGTVLISAGAIMVAFAK